MTYVFDTSSFRVLAHYYPNHFPKFWDLFNNLVVTKNIISTREVLRELDKQVSKQHLRDWLNANRGVFLLPTPDETQFIAQIFAVPHFQYLVSQKQILAGNPVADPFVIASGSVRNACVVTEETKKENAARIPNVCEHFGIDCTSLEGLMEREAWTF